MSETAGVTPAVSPLEDPEHDAGSEGSAAALAEHDRELVAALLGAAPDSERVARAAARLQRLAPEIAGACADDAGAALQRVAMEADTLSTRAADVDAQLRALVQEHRGAALGAAQCARRALDTCDGAAERLDRVTAAAPRFAAALDTFLGAAQQSVARWERIQRAFARLPPVAELVAIPRLLDTAVRCRAYEQAVQLILYVDTVIAPAAAAPATTTQKDDDGDVEGKTRTARKTTKESDDDSTKSNSSDRKNKNTSSAPANEGSCGVTGSDPGGEPGKDGRAAVAQVVAETRRLRGVLVRALVEELCGAVQLPAVVRAAGVFARLRAFTPLQTRALFLACRAAHLRALCAQLDGLTPYSRITRLNDIVRTTLFDVATQYRAIFAVAGVAGVADSEHQQEQQEQQALQLHAWLVERCEWYVGELRALLAQVADGAALASLLEQCMYTGASLARVGVDLRPRVAPLFAARVRTLFRAALAATAAQFAAALGACSFTAATRLVASSASAPTTRNTTAPGAPPARLADISLLAALTNSVVAALNELRPCAVLALQQPLACVLSDTLRTLVSVVATKAAAATAPAERAAAHAFCEALADDALPYIARCFDAVWDAPVPLIDTVRLMEPLGPFVSRDDDESTPEEATVETKPEETSPDTEESSQEATTEATTTTAPEQEDNSVSETA